MSDNRDAAQLLAQLNSLGIIAHRDGDSLRLQGKTQRLTPEQNAALIAQKAEVLALMPSADSSYRDENAQGIGSDLLDLFADLLSACLARDMPKGNFDLGPSPSGGLYAVTDLATFVNYSAKQFSSTRDPQYLDDLSLCQRAWRLWKAQSVS